MFNKEQVQNAIKEIDASLANLQGPRQAHLALVNDMKLVQDVCMTYFMHIEAKKAAPEKKDVRANKPIISVEPCNSDC